MSGKDVMSVEECAEYLGFSPYTIREKAREGEIPGRKIGKEWRFSRRVLLEFVENRRLSDRDVAIANEMIAEYRDSTPSEEPRQCHS